MEESDWSSVLTAGSIALGLGYMFYSFLLLHPHLWLWKTSKKNLPKSAKRIAHRGSRMENLPENTMAAFKAALKSGADVLECDVWLTTDQQVVIHHDESLLRMTGTDKKIHELSYKDLPKIKVESYSSEYTKEEQEKLPRLAELLDLLPDDVGIIIEFKQDSWELIKYVHQMITDKKKIGSVFWFSLVDKINRNLRQFDPTVPTITSIPGLLGILIQYYLGTIPFVNIKESVFGITLEEITLEKVRNEKALQKAPEWVKVLLSYVLQGRPPYFMLCKKLFTHLRRRGVYVLFLGVNTEEDLQLAVRCGVTGVITDRITWLTTTMQEKGLKFKELYE